MDNSPGNLRPPVTDQDVEVVTRVEELAYDLKIRDIMSRSVRFVGPNNRMADVLEILRQHRFSGLPVLDQEELQGVVSLEDLIRAIQENKLNSPVSEFMSHRVISVHEFDAAVEAIETFTRFKVGRLPVVDEEGRLVGMVTKGDITRGLLHALQKDYQVEELRRYRASHLFEDIHSDRTSLILRYHIKAGDFSNGGVASSNIKRALLRLGASPQIARRCGIAIYEAEMNLIIHTTEGGVIRIEIEPQRILMQARDDGPGISDINLAMQAGYSTAPESVRELGFGAGMGLLNIKRCVDKMILESEPGNGTRLELKIYLNQEDSLRESSYFQNEENK
jgi:CBS domain-containing protein/anti-sigma regulatory factor (Ser/Thr protein kinase)